MDAAAILDIPAGPRAYGTGRRAGRDRLVLLSSPAILSS